MNLTQQEFIANIEWAFSNLRYPFWENDQIYDTMYFSNQSILDKAYWVILKSLWNSVWKR